MKTKLNTSNSLRRFLIKSVLLAVFLLLSQVETIRAQTLPYARIDFYYDASRSTETAWNDFYRVYPGIVTFWEDASSTIPWTGATPATINISYMQQYDDAPIYESYMGSMSPSVFVDYPGYLYADNLTWPSNSYPYFHSDRIWYAIKPGDDYLIADNQGQP